jgi:hypothetical protein
MNRPDRRDGDHVYRFECAQHGGSRDFTSEVLRDEFHKRHLEALHGVQPARPF